MLMYQARYRNDCRTHNHKDQIKPDKTSTNYRQTWGAVTDVICEDDTQLPDLILHIDWVQSERIKEGRVSESNSAMKSVKNHLCKFRKTKAVTNTEWSNTHSHCGQWTVSLWFLFLVGVTEVQRSFIHPEQLTDPIMSIKLSILIHHLHNTDTHTLTVLF